MTEHRLLVTGFQAFQSINPNPSELLIRYLAKYAKTNYRLIGAVLPVTYQGCSDFITSLARSAGIDGIIMTGVHPGRRTMTLEKRARNLQNSKNADNAGDIRRGIHVIPDAPDILETPVDIHAMANRMSTPSLPVRISLHAGSYVCNSLYFETLYHLKSVIDRMVFVHIPLLSGQWTIRDMSHCIQTMADELFCEKKTQRKGRLRTTGDAEQFLYSFVNYERKTGVAYSEANYSLDRFKGYLGLQDNPHLGRQSVHIAGTKGKGCVSAFLASLLSAQGCRTGLYTSPHLIDIRERIRLDGKAVSKGDFAELAEAQKNLCESGEYYPEKAFRTTFELLTAMAFQYFDQQDTDWAVLETGMGGRLDCTNVVMPAVAAITRIDMDHMDSLGNTLRRISLEKAGIMKPGIPVIISRQTPYVNGILRSYAKKIASPITNAVSVVPCRNITFDRNGTSFSAKICHHWHHHLRINLPGVFQLENCRLALALLQELALNKKWHPDMKAVYEGLARVRWPGRFQMIAPDALVPGFSARTVIVDGAHNPRAIRSLMNSVRTLFPGKPCAVIIGCSGNKDARGMLKAIAAAGARICVTSFRNSRALSSQALAEIAGSTGIRVMETPDLIHAVKKLQTCIIPDEIVIVTGSLYLAGECLNLGGLREYCLDVY